MTVKEQEFWKALRDFTTRGREFCDEVFNSFEKFIEYEEGRFEGLSNPTQDECDSVILRLVDENVGIGVEYNVIADNDQQMSKSDKAAEKEVKKEMPCQFND